MSSDNTPPATVLRGPFSLLGILSFFIAMIGVPPIVTAKGGALLTLFGMPIEVVGMFAIVGACLLVFYRLAMRSMPHPIACIALCLFALIVGSRMCSPQYFEFTMQKFGAGHIRSSVLDRPEFQEFVGRVKESMILNNESRRPLLTKSEIPDLFRHVFPDHSPAVFFVRNPEKADDFRVQIRWSNKVYKWIVVNDAERSAFWDEFPPEFELLDNGWWLGVYTVVTD